VVVEVERKAIFGYNERACCYHERGKSFSVLIKVMVDSGKGYVVDAIVHG
jgi:hypothetical protein